MSTNGVSKLPIFRERFIKLRGNMSQVDFAKKIGVSAPVIGHYEAGRRVPDAHILIKISNACEVSVDWLLGRTNDKKGNVDIMAVEKRLGLAPETQELLAMWVNNKLENAINTVNLLFSDGDGVGVIWAIENYLFCINDSLHTVSTNNNDILLSDSELSGVFLIEIWKRLVKLRNDPDAMSVVPII